LGDEPQKAEHLKMARDIAAGLDGSDRKVLEADLDALEGS
jgi:hypothetical protein